MMRAVWKEVGDLFWPISRGLHVTLKHFFKVPITVQYPAQKINLASRFRGRLFCVMEDCIGCDNCAVVCPTSCISMDLVRKPKDAPKERTSDGTEKKILVTRFDIDLTRCMFCGLCTIPCPTECLTMSAGYEHAFYDKDDWVLRFGANTEDPDMLALGKSPQGEETAAAAESSLKREA